MGGEASACLVRTFSQPSPNSSEEKKGNPLHRALTTSISFGRFVSESLDWEKWSAFTHNRYLEEVERYSKPGSVAEKKAYFEAHFKRRRAQALLEQQNLGSETNTNTKIEDQDLDLPHRDNKYVAPKDIKEGEIQNNVPVCPFDQQTDPSDASIEVKLEKTLPGGEVEKVTELPVLLENAVELTDHLVESDRCTSDVLSTDQDKDDSAVRNSASSGQKKTEVSSSKILSSGGASQCTGSVKEQTLPVELRNSEKIKNSENNATDSNNKRRSYATSLHMSINFAYRETGKSTLPGQRKVETSRLIRDPAKKYKNSTFPQSSTRASVNGVFKDHSATPSAQKRRIKTPFGDSICGMRTVDAKVFSPSTSFSKSSNAFGNKARSPTVPSSFTFKSEERASKRKEKLELKFKSMDTTDKQLQAKSQVKGKSNSMDLRNSTVLKSAKDAEAHTIPAVCFPKIEERALKFQNSNNDSRPPWRISVKTEGLKRISGNNVRPPIYSTKCLSKKSPNENASPNIQP